MMNFYKSVIEHRGKLLVRGIHEGQDYKEKIDFGPTLYSLTQKESKFKTLDNRNLNPIKFKDISAARQFRREVATQNSPVYGLERYHYQYINEQFPQNIKWDKKFIKMYYILLNHIC